MSRVLPFRGLHYDPDRVGDLTAATSPPYDVISDAQQQHYRALSPWNVVRLETNDKGLDAEERAARHAEAARCLKGWTAEGVLRRDPEPRFYPYEMAFTFEGRQRTIRGLICAVEIEPWGGSIIPHEHVMARQVEDRLTLMRSTQANFSPIYAVFSGPSRPVADLLNRLEAPLSQVTDEEGVTHRLWSVADPAITDDLAEQDLLIADGHHRYTVALAYRDEMRARFGPGPWDEVMMFVVDAATQDPPVLPIHRLLRDPVAMDAGPVDGLDAALQGAQDDPPSVGWIQPGPVYGVVALDGPPPAVSALHADLLAGLEGGRDLVFTPDAAEADAAVRSGEAAMAALLPPTTAERIREVIDRGQRMPQKSTFFWPKPRTGMVLRAMETAPAAPAS